MRRSIRVVLNVLLGIRFLAAVTCLTTLTSVLPAAEPSAGERLHALLRSDFDSARDVRDRWPDLSPEGLRAREAQDRTALDNLHSIPPDQLAAEDRTLYRVFERDLTLRLEQFRLRLYLTPYWEHIHLGRWLSGLSGMPGQARPQDLNQAEHLLRRLEAYPRYIRQVIGLLGESRRAGILPPVQVARDLLAAIDTRIRGRSAFTYGQQPKSSGTNAIILLDSAENSPFYAAFTSLPGIAADDRTRIQGQARTVIREQVQPAVEELRRYLTEEYLPACPEHMSLTEWPNGAEIYRHLARRYTTTALDPKEVHDLGVREVARIRAAMSAVVAGTGYKGSLDEFLRASQTDPRFFYTAADDLLAAYRTALERIRPLVPKVISKVPGAPLTIEAGRYGGPAAMYRPAWPGDAAKRAAAIVVDVSKLDLRPKFEIIPLVLHEGIPGHHVQFASDPRPQPAGSDGLWEFEQRMRQCNAFTEGWALYAEGLGDELGLYADPMDKFGQLSWDLVRAIRLVIDTGIHAYGWSTERATQYFIAQTGKPASAADEEIARTIRPGSQLAYKVGEQRIKLMRERAQKALGPKFDLRRFHDVLLAWGPLPLEILERRMDDCLRDASCSGKLLAGYGFVSGHGFSRAEWRKQDRASAPATRETPRIAFCRPFRG